MKSRPKISLIILTYNWPSALDLVLQSVMQQSLLPDEVIVADDGSTAETAAVIQAFQTRLPCPLIHAWQADEGFRAAAARNLGVANSNGDYLIFIDGDVILHPDFIRDHHLLARANQYVVGSRVLLKQTTTEIALREGKFQFSLCHTAATNKENALHFVFLNHLMPAKNQPVRQLIFKVRTCNMAVWRDDFLKVNGFNTAFAGWGREDSEFALRLLHAGLSQKRAKFAAIQYHLFHNEADRSQLDANDKRLEAAITKGEYWCETGFSSLLY